MTWSFLYFSLGLQVAVVLIALAAGRLHEWDLDRKIRQRRRQAGE